MRGEREPVSLGITEHRSSQVLTRHDRLLGFIWYKLAMGNAIDEQKREYRTLASREEETPIVSNAADGVDSDSDVDPNDAPVAAAPLPSKSKDPYEALEDEDDDY